MNDLIAEYRNNAPEEPEEDLLSPHGRPWQEVADINVELGVGHMHTAPPKLKWDQIPMYATAYPDRKPIDYFMLMYPMQHIPTLLQNTNASINSDFNRTGGALSQGEYMKYLGIQLAKAVDPAYGGYEQYWSTNSSTECTTIQPRNYGERFNMSKHRYETITRNLKCNIIETPTILKVNAIILWIICVRHV